MKRRSGRRSNIRKVLEQADETDISEGRVSYFRYNEVLRNLAAFYGVGFPECVAVFVALSPNNDYRGNLRSAASVIKGFKDGIERDRIRVSGYLHCRDRAFAYLDGSAEFLSTAKGQRFDRFIRTS